MSMIYSIVIIFLKGALCLKQLQIKSSANWRYFCFGAGLGAIVFLLIYGLSPLDVSNDIWLRNGYIEADIQQHYAGWIFYRQSPISIPFCFSPNINWPSGLSVAFTDSIPLFAALFRLLSPILPTTFQYFGLYTLLCFMLQGGFAALLIRLFTKNWGTIFLGSLLFLCSPILLERAFRHTALAAHFFVLGTLYYYILGTREKKFAYKGLFALNCLTLSIHPYFAPMTYAVTFALIVEQIAWQRQWKKPISFLLCNLLGTALVGWLFGLFSGGSAAGGSGIQYGYFSMNLNALWNPSSRNMPSWSLFLPQQNQTLGNYDGFNYLGLGILVCTTAIAIAWIASYKSTHPLHTLKQRFGLLFVCLCLTAFAVSNVVTANGAILARLPLPQSIVNIATTLRSSGRLFWPVYYLIFLFVIVGLIRLAGNEKGRTQIFALAALVMVQLVDLSPALMQKMQSLRNYQPQGYNLLAQDDTSGLSAFLSATENRYQHFVALDPLPKTGLSLALYTADHGMTSSDTSFVARYDEEQAAQRRQDYIQAIQNGSMPTDTLFATEQESTFLQLADAAQAQGAWCGAITTQENGIAVPLLYIIAPNMQYSGPFALEYSESFPLHIADYTDDYWQHGILSLNLDNIGREQDKNRVVLFYDTPLARRKLENASYLVADDQKYPIISVSDQDAGWLMVTLDIDDAHTLYQNGYSKDLETIS